MRAYFARCMCFARCTFCKINISQGSVMTPFMCGGNCINRFVPNCVPSLTVEDFLKSVNIRGRYRQQVSATFFDLPCITLNRARIYRLIFCQNVLRPEALICCQLRGPITEVCGTNVFERGPGAEPLVHGVWWAKPPEAGVYMPFLSELSA